MIIKKIVPVLLFMSLFGMRAAYAQGTWTAPAVPGEDLSTLSESTDVYVYNIECDAIFSRGFNWLTMALADRPEDGDNAVPAARQKVQIRRDGSNIKIHWNDRGNDVFFGQADNTDAGSMWTDLGNAGNRVVFTPAASADYPNAYTLTNVQHNLKVDVLWARGGKLTLWNGKGFYDWAFLTGDAFTSGKLAQFKARKAMWNLYQALVKADAVAANADALTAANTVYTNDAATTDELRAAFRTMFLAVAGSIEDPVDVSYMFTHPDMSGDKTAAGWSYSDFAISAGECEKYHAAFTSNQTITDAPNGLYDVTMTGIYRQDDGQTQDAPQLLVSNGTTEAAGDFPNMEYMGGKWDIGGNPSNDWVNCSTGKMPKWMWSASDAQAHDEAGVTIENVKVQDYTLGVTFKVTGGNQWFNFQRIFVTYKGSINMGLYKTLLTKIAEANQFVDEKDGVILASFITAITDAVSAASGLDANSTEEALTDACDAISAALTAAGVAPTIEKFNELQALITAASADGINTADAEAVAANPTTLAAVEDQIEILTNARILVATIALAKTEGLTTTAEEAVVVANPLVLADIKDALFDLRSARKVNAQRMPDIYTGSAPAAGKVYLFNLGTGMFLGTGSSYNTHAAVDQVGIEVELIAEGDGFKIKTGRGGGWMAKGNAEASVYVDTWTSNQVWTFLPVSGKDGVYNISFDGSATNLLGYNPRSKNDDQDHKGIYWGSIGIKREDGADPMNQWKVITLDERASLIAAATLDNPVDVSYLIGSPSMNAQDSRDTDWTRNVSGGNSGWINNTENHGFEAWNSDNANFYQTLQNLPAGKYEVSVSGFWREGSGDHQAEIVNNGGTLNQNAYLYADDQTAQLDNVASCPDFVPGVATQPSVIGSFPNWPDEALQYFETGAFKKTVEVTVGATGELTIGVRIDEKVTYGDWLVIDNFRLTYLGPVVTIGDALYATYVAPFDVDFTGSAVSAFAAQLRTSYVHLEPVTTVPAGEAVVVKAEAAGTYPVIGTTGASLGTTNDLLASDGTAQGDNVYVLGMPEGKQVGFYRIETGTSVAAGKGYLVITGGDIKEFYGFDDDATGINNVDANVSLNEEIFNLAGQRMSKAQKGINIVNGKKVIR